MVNGEVVEVAEGATLRDLLPPADPEPRRGVAIARNGEVVPRSGWNEVRVEAGDRIEILHAVGGG
jgi:thiamine biosynthesis protein ThiS